MNALIDHRDKKEGQLANKRSNNGTNFKIVSGRKNMPKSRTMMPVSDETRKVKGAHAVLKGPVEEEKFATDEPTPNMSARDRAQEQ